MTDKELQEKCKLISKQFADSMDMWNRVMLEASKGWGVYLSFTNETLFDVINVCFAALNTRAFQSGWITAENVKEKTVALRKAIKEFSGIDTRLLAHEVIKNNKTDEI